MGFVRYGCSNSSSLSVVMTDSSHSNKFNFYCFTNFRDQEMDEAFFESL